MVVSHFKKEFTSDEFFIHLHHQNLKDSFSHDFAIIKNIFTKIITNTTLISLI